MGKGTYATTPPQTPLPADKRPDSRINPRIFQAQTALLELTDQFVAVGFEHGPQQAISHLLTQWLTTPADELSTQASSDQFHCTLLFIDFLRELYRAKSAAEAN